MKHQYTGLKRIIEAFKNSLDGFSYAFREEEAFRQDILLFLIGLIIVFLVPFPFIEKVLLFSALFFIVFAEIVNSAFEGVIDRISSEWHSLSKAVKDMGSLLVLFAFIYFFIVWGGIFFKFLFKV